MGGNRATLSRLSPMQPGQLRRLHALWRRWTRSLALSTEASRRLRHYYIWLITHYQCTETKALTERQAAQVVQWLAAVVRRVEAKQNYVAGTAGRRGFPEHRRIPPNRAAWHALWNSAASLGMDRNDVDRFIRRHYAGVGLRGVADLRTMADLNRVLWGLKAMLRNRNKLMPLPNPQRRAA
jgi:hypothetical protein